MSFTGFEGHGIGTAILNQIEECAIQLGLPATILDFTNDTRELYLKRFYENRGYIFLRFDTSTKPDKFFYLGGEKILIPDVEDSVHSTDTLPLLFYIKILATPEEPFKKSSTCP